MRLRGQLLVATCGTALFCVAAGDRLLTWRAHARGVEALDRELSTGQSAIERQRVLRRGELRGILQGIAKQSYFHAYLATRDRAQMGYFATSARNAGADAVVITDASGTSLAEEGAGAAGLAELARSPSVRASGGLAEVRGVLVDVTAIPVGEDGSMGFLIGATRVSKEAIAADGAPFGIEAGLEAGDVVVSSLPPEVALAALRALDAPATVASRAGVEYRVCARAFGVGRMIVAAPLKRAEAFTSDLTRLAGILFLVVLTVAASGVVVAMNRLTAPLERMQRAIESLGRGDPVTSAHLLEGLVARRDEIGALARSHVDAAQRLQSMIATCKQLSRGIERTLARTNRLVNQVDTNAQSELFGEIAAASRALAVALNEVWTVTAEAQVHGRGVATELSRLESGSSAGSAAVERARSLVAAAEQKLGDLDGAVGRDLGRVLGQLEAQLGSIDKSQQAQGRGIQAALERLELLRGQIDKVASAQFREQHGRNQASRAVENLSRLVKSYGQDALAVRTGVGDLGRQVERLQLALTMVQDAAEPAAEPEAAEAKPPLRSAAQ